MRNQLPIPFYLFLDVHWYVILSVLGTTGFLITLFVVLIFQMTCFPEFGVNRFYMVLTGVLSFIGQIFFALWTKFENAAAGALLRKAFDVILAFLFQMLFFQVKSISFTKGFRVAKCLCKGS